MLALRILAAPTPGHQEAVKVPATDALDESGAAAQAVALQLSLSSRMGTSADARQGRREEADPRPAL